MKRSPLKRKRIVLTRSAAAGKEWGDYLKKQGALVEQFPTIKVSAVPLTKKLHHAIADLDRFGWIVFTSPAGPYFLKGAIGGSAMRKTTKNLRMPPIAAIGKKTAAAVKDAGYKTAFMPSKSDSATLGRELKRTILPLLLLRTDIASDELPKALTARGMRVVDVTIYKTTLVRTPAPRRFLKLLETGAVDAVIFASPSAVQGFMARVKKNSMKSARHIPAVALGPRVAAALRQAKFTTISTAREATIKSIADAIVRRERYNV